MLLRPLLILWASQAVNFDMSVLYYNTLISVNEQRGPRYILPTRNAEFEAGVKSEKIEDFGTYDFIIVGAGSAGSVLATRLSEIYDWDILLLEAGGEEDDFSDIPGMMLYLQFSEMNWGYYTTSQTNCCLGMRQKRCMSPRGKVIGGTGTINALMYARGNPRDYDTWEEMGNPGWNYKDVLPYFRKSEHAQIDADPGYHGFGGEWGVEYSLPATDTFPNFIEAHLEKKIPILDYNGWYQMGASKVQVNTRNGRRQSAGRAFLSGSRKRRNLNVVTRALVTKIIIDEHSKTAEGVVFARTDGHKYEARARKEVIISGGTVNTPQLLMLSGIGPKEHLKEKGIKVIHNLPAVGQHFREHPKFNGLTFRTNKRVRDNILEDQIRQYLNGEGPLTSPGNSDAIGYVNVGGEPRDRPNIEYIYIPSNSSSPIDQRIYNWNNQITRDYVNKINSMTDVKFYMILLHPRSEGSVRLKSKDPVDFPEIDFNMFEQQEDVDTMIRGIGYILDLVDTEAFRKIKATFLDLPVCEQHEKYSHAFWDCAVRTMSTTQYHPCGTAQMGPDPSDSVVDHKLKVHGMNKLRVVDASVFPTQVSGHTNAPAIMAAEKISDEIKQYYHKLYN